MAKQLYKLPLSKKHKADLLKGRDILLNIKDLKKILGEKVINS